VISKKSQSALLAKYYAQFKKKPRSKVFAPLAESFRRLGMLDDAFKILREGIKNHPNYPLGYIVLAHCYYDQEKYDLTYHTLRPFVSKNADNISMQKIFAEACLKIGHHDEALETYKYLLFLNPRDKFFAEQVKKLEDDLLIGHKVLSVDQLVKAPGLEVLPKLENFEDDWVQVDFNENLSASEETEDKSLTSTNEYWVMNKPSAINHPILKNEEIQERDLEDEYFADEFEKDYGPSEETISETKIEEPIVSHTLIDLYCAQDYFEKAVELLEKIIELNPNDKISSEKLIQVKKLRDSKKISLKVVNEQEGHDELISIIEHQVKQAPPKKDLIEKKFQMFLNALKERSIQLR